MNHYTELLVELFKRRNFERLTTPDFKQQVKALEVLTDDHIEEVIYGGGAGGAKSFTGWMWLCLSALAYEETHYFVARETLKDITLYGLQTFSEVKNKLKLSENDYKYRAQYGIIEFNNKSKIYLIECKKRPSDIDFHSLGSSLFTSGFIEEAGEVHFDAFDTLCSRVGRWKNDEYGLIGKVFITCNPSKNWLYTNYYAPNKKGKLKTNQIFIPALAKNNPYGQSDYLKKLQNLKDPTKRARLLEGDWEYSDDPNELCDYDAICDMFANDHVAEGGKRISADLAMKGRDRFVAGLWSGLICNVKIDIEKCGGKDIQLKLEELKIEGGVGNSQIVADADGLGNYLESYIKGIKEFHGGSSAKDKKNYHNLKSECGYKLAEFINSRAIKVVCSPQQQEEIKKELSICLKADNIDTDGKKKIITKDKMKALLGRSPDYLDMLLMGMVFHIKKKQKGFWD